LYCSYGIDTIQRMEPSRLWRTVPVYTIPSFLGLSCEEVTVGKGKKPKNGKREVPRKESSKSVWRQAVGSLSRVSYSREYRP
jgi:hypothetical protein